MGTNISRVLNVVPLTGPAFKLVSQAFTPVALTKTVTVVLPGKPLTVCVNPADPELGATKLLPPFVLIKYPVAPVTAGHEKVRDEKEIASAAIELLSNSDSANQMGMNGREWILENWRWEKWSKDFEDLLYK